MQVTIVSNVENGTHKFQVRPLHSLHTFPWEGGGVMNLFSQYIVPFRAAEFKIRKGNRRSTASFPQNKCVFTHTCLKDTIITSILKG